MENAKLQKSFSATLGVLDDNYNHGKINSKGKK